VSGLLRLAWSHARHHWGRSLILIACLTVTLMLPLAVKRLVDHFEQDLMARALATPLIVGAKGNRFDLVLKSLYFDTDYAEAVTMADVEPVEERGFGRAIPLHARFSAHSMQGGEEAGSFESAPVVGTTLAYFDFRGLTLTDGTMPLFLGDAVVGAKAAEQLGVGVGDAVLSDPPNAYDPSQSFQLKMPVVGILAESGTADDGAIFVDLKTTWVLEGIGHGHEDLKTVENSGIVDEERSDASNIVATARLARYQEITPENMSSFHFHGDRGGFPITSFILVPASDKMRTIALGWYNLSETRELLEPESVVSELMGLVFRIKRFFDANALVVGATTALLVALVLLLSWRLREREMATLFKIGCARGVMVGLQAVEILMLLAISVGLALAGAVAAVQAAPWFFTVLAS
jgi:putative ABC transport system permease protein